MYKVKICGISESPHLHAAVKGGASYIGFVFFEKSRRNVPIKIAQMLTSEVPHGVIRVALMVDPSDSFIRETLKNVPIDMLQLHGQESCERVQNIRKLSNLPVMKAVGVNSRDDLAKIVQYERVSDQILVDAKPPKGASVPGGLGRSFEWDILKNYEINKPWLLAGGLTVENVRTALRKTGANQFDVSSGVENRFGIKSEKKIFEFLNVLRGDLDA